MEKAKVSKAVFEALKDWEEECDDPFLSAMNLKTKGVPFISKKFLPLNSVDIKEIAKCFIVGYELEKTPEENILEKWDIAQNMHAKNCFYYREGVYDTLKELKVNIKGINI